MSKIIEPGEVAKINGNNDLMMDRDLGAHVGEIVDVVRVRKSGLIEVKTSAGVKAYPRRNLTMLRIGTFPSSPVRATPITGPVQVYEDKWPHG